MHKSVERAAIAKVAGQLEQDGYTVAIEPGASAVPFDLAGYQPDIIAKKGGETVIVEVKTRSSPQTLERYKHIAERVATQPHWRFLISTVSPDTLDEDAPSTNSEDLQALTAYLSRVSLLLRSENDAFATPYLWSALMHAMREYSSRKGVPVDSNSDLRVLNYMYSLGELSNEDYQQARHYHALRNNLLHRLDAQPDRSQVLGLAAFLKAKLQEWGIPGGEVLQVDNPVQ
jgi:hypothetical protein